MVSRAVGENLSLMKEHCSSRLRLLITVKSSRWYDLLRHSMEGEPAWSTEYPIPMANRSISEAGRYNWPIFR